MKPDKFNFLMLLTNSGNATVAMVAGTTAENIEKIRAGKASMPDSPAFISAVAGHFADRIRVLKKQSTASSVLLTDGVWPEEKPLAAKIIADWLLTDSDKLSERISALLSNQSARTDFPGISPTPPAGVASGAAGVSSLPVSDDTPANSNRTFMGNDGKRRGLTLAFEILCKDPKPYELLIYSDESLSWFTEDRTFFDQWKNYCLQLINTGSTITMIEGLNRSDEEMKEGLRMWAPIVLTGALRTFHCDAPVDSLYNRTLFIARGKAAFTCNSLRLSDYHAVNTLFTDPQAVNSFAEEFDSYLSICKPMYDSYAAGEWKDFQPVATDFLNADDDLICVSSAPTLTEPSGSGHTVTDIVILPKKEDLLNGNVPVPMQMLTHTSKKYYKPVEYLTLLEQAMTMASGNKKYSLIASTGAGLPEHIFLLFKPETGLLYGVTSPAERMLHIEKPELMTAFRSLLDRFISLSNLRIVNELKIKKYIADIRQTMR